MRFLILGPLEVRGEQGAVALGGTKLRGLLAVLLLHANTPVSAERLALALWGEDAPDGVTKTVQVTVWRLRKALGDRVVIATTPAGYCLEMQPDALDATRFERLAEDGSRALAGGRPEQAGAVLREALSLWRGPALADLAFEPFAAAEITRLEEQRLAALEGRIEADLEAGRHTELVSELRRLVVVNPTRERLAAQLMLALYRCGRQTEALEAYQHTRRVLIADIGIEPGPQLRELQEAVLRQDAALARRDVTPDRPPTLGTASTSSLSAGEDEPIVPALPRPLRIPAGLPFVGREAELERLHACWTTVGGGRRSAVVIGGEPGIGKTRLASEFAHEVGQRGAPVLYGRCDEGLAVPYQPFLQALAPYVRAVGLDRLRAQLGHLAPELGRMWPELAGLGEPFHGDAESERFALFDAIAALIEAVTQDGPLLLILDDLHWAATPTLLLLRHLVRSERQLDVLLLGTHRHTELDRNEPLARLLADLQRDASVERVSIGGLPEPTIAGLLEATGEYAPDKRRDLARRLAAQTTGNPFFIRELLTHLAESATSSPGTQRCDLDVTAVQLDPSEGLRHVIGQRVARLSAPTGCALRVAAVAGHAFSFVLLERVLGEPAGVIDALDEAVGAGLLAEAGHGDYSFAHALVRQTIYERLGSARRMRLHRQLGDALESLADPDAHVEELAHHFMQAAADGQGVKAAGYALAAGRSATSRLGHEEAAAHYEQGLEALAIGGEPYEQMRCELLLALGEARWNTGRLDHARQAYEQAAELAERSGDTTALGRAAVDFCGPHRGELDTALTRPVAGLLQRALAALDAKDSSLRARLMGRLGAMLAHTDDEQGTPVLTHQALQMARRVGDKATLADVLASTLWAIRGPDSVHESLVLAAELGRLADEIGDDTTRALTHLRLLDLRFQLGDVEAVDCELEALQQLAQRRAEPYFTWLVAQVRVGRAFLEGRLQDCEALAQDAMTRRFEGHDETAGRIFGTQMFFIRHEQGQLDELLQASRNLTEQYPQIPAARCALAVNYVELGLTAQAQRELEELARDDFCHLPRDDSWLSNLAGLSVVASTLGDARRVQLLYTLLLRYADRCMNKGLLLSLGCVSRPLGNLATTLSRYEDAEEHFEQALKINTRIRSPLWIGHTRLGYARMLLLRNDPGDNDKALHLLTQAIATAQALGLTLLADKARPLKLAAQAAATATHRAAPA
jgi:DNA-binding SARP family transcriptional activator